MYCGVSWFCTPPCLLTRHHKMGNFLRKCVLQDQIHRHCFVFNTSSVWSSFPPLVTTEQKLCGVSPGAVTGGRQRLATVQYEDLSLTGFHDHVPLMPFVVLRVHLDHSITHWLLWSCLLSVPWEELGGRKPGRSQLLQDSSTMCHLHIVLAIEQMQSVWQMTQCTVPVRKQASLWPMSVFMCGVKCS